MAETIEGVIAASRSMSADASQGYIRYMDSSEFMEVVKTAAEDVMEEEIGSLETEIAGKSPIGHTHDDRYYTESEIDTKLSGKQDSTDNNLMTTSKTVVGAINELSDSVDSLEPRASQTEKELWDIKVGKGGKNLNSYPYFSTTSKSNNITFTDNGDGTVTVNTDGAASGNTWWNCHTRAQGERNDLIIPNGQYRVVGTPNGGSGGVNYGIQVTRTKGGSGVSYGTDYGNGLNFTANGDDYSDTEVSIQIQIYVKSGAVINNLVFKPMLTTDLNATYDDYEPYTPYNVREIGYASDDVKWLGWSVPHNMPMKNYTDSNGVFHQRVGRVCLGDLSWVYVDTSTPPYFRTSDVTKKAIGRNNLYCSKYPLRTVVGNDATYSIDGLATNANVYIRDYNFTDATQLKASLSNTYLYYELASEVTMAEGSEVSSTTKDIKDLSNSVVGSVTYAKSIKVGNMVMLRYEVTSSGTVSAWSSLFTVNSKHKPIDLIRALAFDPYTGNTYPISINAEGVCSNGGVTIPATLIYISVTYITN